MRRINCFQFIVLFGLMNQAIADDLTPKLEPKDAIFFVCYQACRVNYSVSAPLATYDAYEYIGCVIQRTPCYHVRQQKNHKRSRPLNVFGQFNNYPDALNAFYRCAYSAQP